MPVQPDSASALYKAAIPGRRRTGLRVVAFLGVSLVTALGSALLLTRYMARTAQDRVPTQKVVVATVELPVGAEIRAENLAVVDWPAASLPDGTFQDPKQLEGKVIAVRVLRREPVLLARLTDGAGGGLSALLPAGMRAAAVRVDDVVGVAGFVQPGDRVDVIVTIRAEGGGTATSSKVIMQYVKVLAVGKELDTKSRADKVVQATVATLMVDPEQSERLALAASQGRLLLTLRSAADAEVVTTTGVTAAALLSKGQAGQEAEAPKPVHHPARLAQVPKPATAVPAAAPAPEQPPPGEVVEILRGNLYEKRKFEGARR
jgi:pilus assembly protein CpaB